MSNIQGSDGMKVIFISALKSELTFPKRGCIYCCFCDVKGDTPENWGRARNLFSSGRVTWDIFDSRMIKFSKMMLKISEKESVRIL
jgi:hypothetical protein